MTLRKAGLLRKLPESDDLFFTIDGSLFRLAGEKIPHLLSGNSQPLSPKGLIRVKARTGYDDLIIIECLNIEFTIKRCTFEAVWSGKMPACTVWERVPDCWNGFNKGEVTA